MENFKCETVEDDMMYEEKDFKCESCGDDLMYRQSVNNLSICITCDEWEQQKIADEADQRANGKTNLD